MQIKKKLVFVIEDNEQFAITIQNELRKQLFVQTLSFETAEVCFKSINEFPEVVIMNFDLDEQNPDAMNGSKALKTFKLLSPETKVIFYSKQDSLEIACNLLDQGAFDYVIKETDFTQKLESSSVKLLLKKVAKALENSFQY
jgi:two-component system response regulator AtoC